MMVLQQLQETKGSVSKRKSPSTNKINSPRFWAVFGEHWAKVRELWFAGSRERFIVVHPVVEREGVVWVREVFYSLLFNFVLLSIQSSSVLLSFSYFAQAAWQASSALSCLLIFEGGLCVIIRKKTGKIITVNESHSLKHSVTSHNYNSCHAIHRRFREEFFLILEVLPTQACCRKSAYIMRKNYCSKGGGGFVTGTKSSERGQIWKHLW